MSKDNKVETNQKAENKVVVNANKIEETETETETKPKPKSKRKKPEVSQEGVTVLTKADSEQIDEKKKQKKFQSNAWGSDRVFKPFED